MTEEKRDEGTVAFQDEFVSVVTLPKKAEPGMMIRVDAQEEWVPRAERDEAFKKGVLEAIEVAKHQQDKWRDPNLYLQDQTAQIVVGELARVIGRMKSLLSD